MAVTVSGEKKFYNGAWFVEERYNGKVWSYQLPSLNYSTKHTEEELIQLRDLLNAVLGE